MDMDADSEDEDYVPPEPVRRTFIHFVLEPLYKIYSHVLGDEPQDLAYAMQELDIKYVIATWLLLMDILSSTCMLFLYFSISLFLYISLYFSILWSGQDLYVY